MFEVDHREEESPSRQRVRLSSLCRRPELSDGWACSENGERCRAVRAREAAGGEDGTVDQAQLARVCPQRGGTWLSGCRWRSAGLSSRQKGGVAIVGFTMTVVSGSLERLGRTLQADDQTERIATAQERELLRETRPLPLRGSPFTNVFVDQGRGAAYVGRDGQCLSASFRLFLLISVLRKHPAVLKVNARHRSLGHKCKQRKTQRSGLEV